MSLYAHYIREREDCKTLENDHGFMTYKVIGEELFIRDWFIDPQYRLTSKARYFAESITEIGRNAKCKYLTCTVCPTANGSTKSIRSILSYGFKLIRNQGDLIILAKEIK
jgi:hypothetical protein